MNKTYLLVAGAALVGLGNGLAWGHFLTKRHMTHHFEEELRVQVEEAKEYYKKVYKRDQFDTPASAAELLLDDDAAVMDSKVDAAATAMKFYRGDPQRKVSDTTTADAELVTRNIFVDGPPSPQEIDENEPHIIPEEEFLQNPNEYEQYNMTYYIGDGVLTDDRDQPVEPHNVDSTVGSDNLEEFKKLDEDEHVIYVRNNRLRCEFEIARHEGKYAVEVLGLRE